MRQFEQRRSQDLALLVDLWAPFDATDAERANVETAVSFVATLIADACRQSGRQLILHLAAATPLEVQGAASPLFYREQMDALALIAAHHEPQFPTELARTLATLPRSVPTFVITTRPIQPDVLQAATVGHDVRPRDRTLWSVDVGSDQLARYYHA